MQINVKIIDSRWLFCKNIYLFIYNFNIYLLIYNINRAGNFCAGHFCAEHFNFLLNPLFWISLLGSDQWVLSADCEYNFSGFLIGGLGSCKRFSDWSNFRHFYTFAKLRLSIVLDVYNSKVFWSVCSFSVLVLYHMLILLTRLKLSAWKVL